MNSLTETSALAGMPACEVRGPARVFGGGERPAHDDLVLRIGERKLEIGVRARHVAAIAHRRRQDQKPLMRGIGLEIGGLNREVGDLARRLDRAAERGAHPRHDRAECRPARRRAPRGNERRSGRPAAGSATAPPPHATCASSRRSLRGPRHRSCRHRRLRPRFAAQLPPAVRRDGGDRHRGRRQQRLRIAQRHRRRARRRLVVGVDVVVDLGAWGASETSCSTPSNTVRQWPQRTCPARIASCGGVTRKTVRQLGQRVYCSSGIESIVGIVRGVGRRSSRVGRRLSDARRQAPPSRHRCSRRRF